MPEKPKLKRLSRAEIAAAMKAPQARSRKQETSAEKVAMDQAGVGLSGASKQWADRFAVMNDPEFWVCIVWRTEEEVDAFAAKYELPRDGRLVAGTDLAAALGVNLEDPAPLRRLRRAKLDKTRTKRMLRYRPHPLPDEVIAVGALKDFMPGEDGFEFHEMVSFVFGELLAVSQDPDWLAQHGETVDYPHYLCFWFANRDETEKLLRLTHLIELGDKYLDGNQVEELLNESS